MEEDHCSYTGTQRLFGNIRIVKWRIEKVEFEGKEEVLRFIDMALSWEGQVRDID